MGHLRPKMMHPQNSGSAVRIVTMLLNESGKERHGNYIDGFSERKINLGQFGHFGPKMVHPHNFGSASGFFLNFAQ